MDGLKKNQLLPIPAVYLEAEHSFEEALSGSSTGSLG
jgi:hypothetical protein